MLHVFTTAALLLVFDTMLRWNFIRMLQGGIDYPPWLVAYAIIGGLAASLAAKFSTAYLLNHVILPEGRGASAASVAIFTCLALTLLIVHLSELPAAGAATRYTFLAEVAYCIAMIFAFRLETRRAFRLIVRADPIGFEPIMTPRRD